MENPTEYTFSWRVGDDTEFSALIYFWTNSDVFGEGYEGYDFRIVFDNLQFRAHLWEFGEFRADSVDKIKSDAFEIYEQIVAFIKAVQS